MASDHSRSNTTPINVKIDQQYELSEAESDTSSIDINMIPHSPVSREQLVKRMESVLQENRVLKVKFVFVYDLYIIMKIRLSNYAISFIFPFL